MGVGNKKQICPLQAKQSNSICSAMAKSNRGNTSANGVISFRYRVANGVALFCLQRQKCPNPSLGNNNKNLGFGFFMSLTTRVGMLKKHFLHKKNEKQMEPARNVGASRKTITKRVCSMPLLRI